MCIRNEANAKTVNTAYRRCVASFFFSFFFFFFIFFFSFFILFLSSVLFRPPLNYSFPGSFCARVKITNFPVLLVA